jgi:glutaredoxin
MKKWEMVIYGIEGCKYCLQLKTELGIMNIPFTYINISDNNELGDKIEEVYKCTVYPIVITNNTQRIIWLSETSLLPSHSVRIFDTINQLLINIKETYEF